MATHILQNLRRAVAGAIGAHGVFTATGGSTSTAICPTAFASTELHAGSFPYVWLYVPGATGTAQRRIKKDGLTNTTTGTITLDGTLTTAISNGTVFELFGRLPASQAAAGVGGAAVRGIHECINETLKRVLVTRVVTITLTSGTRDYSLASIAGLDRPERLVEVRVTNADGSSRNVVDRYEGPHRWTFQDNVEGPNLHFHAPWTFTSGTYTLNVECRVPAFNHIRVSGTWASSTVGLVNESDACGDDEDEIMTGSLAFAYQALAATSYGADYARFAPLAETTMAEFKAKPGYIELGTSPQPAPPARSRSGAAA